MKRHVRSISAIAGAVAILALLGVSPADAQLNGENLLGDNGVKSGTQPAPGFYAGTLYYGYKTDTIKGRMGLSSTRIHRDPAVRRSTRSSRWSVTYPTRRSWPPTTG